MSVDYRVVNSIAIVEVNNPPVNALSVKVRTHFKAAVERSIGDSKVQAILITGKKSFLGGADITEFSTGQGRKYPTISDVCDALESSPKPVVAAISGYALGGGAEIAISCHYRVMEQAAMFGFPEVDIGILPAATGTQRFPRLAGLKTALDLIPSGRRVTGTEAFQLGFVDKVVAGDVINAAMQFASGIGDMDVESRRTSRKMVLDADKLESLKDAALRRSKKKQRGLLAPELAIRAVCASVLPYEEGLVIEAQLFGQLSTSGQSRALQHAFFAQRAATKWRMPDGRTSRAPNRRPQFCGVIGGGTMGTGIAMAALNGGLKVVLVEQNQQFLGRAMATLKTLYVGSVRLGRVSKAEAQTRMRHLTGTTKFEDLKDCDIVIEAVFENMNVKKEVFKKLDRVCKQGAILASNTSTLDIDEMASVTSRPESVVGTHFFVPAYHMKLLENILGAKTSLETVASVMAFGLQINKVPVLVGNCRGFAGNRMQAPKSLECNFLVEEGASPEDVDRVMEDFGFPIGPFKVADLTGLDIGHSIRSGIMQSKGAKLDYNRMHIDGVRQSYLSDELWELGRYGRKKGAGWYRYAEPGAREAFSDPETNKVITEYCKKRSINRRLIGSQEILERCLYSLINEGFKVLEEGIAAKPEDLDTIWILGYGWPKQTGGPMYYASTVGLKTIYQRVCKYFEQHPTSPHWQPSALLTSLAQSGRSVKDWKKPRMAQL